MKWEFRRAMTSQSLRCRASKSAIRARRYSFNRRSVTSRTRRSWAALLAVKQGLGYPTFHAALPITITEYGALAVSLLLAAGVSRQFEHYRKALVHLLVGDLQDRSQAFQDGQAALYREIRRARVFERPLTLVTLDIAPGAPCLVVERRTWQGGVPVTHVRLAYPGERHQLIGRFSPAMRAPSKEG